MVIQLIKRWIRRKKSRGQTATAQYIDRLNQAIERDTEARLSELREDLIKKTIEVNLENAEKCEGFRVERANLSDVRKDETLIIRRSDDYKKLTTAKVIMIGESVVRVKFDKKIPDQKGYRNFKITRRLDSKGPLTRRTRAKNALGRLRTFSCSPPIHKSILGSFRDSDNIKFNKARAVPMKGLINVKGVQRSAIEQAMKKRISLIEGVSGSGKTLIAAHIASSMSRSRKRKILLCSPMKSTVDKLVGMIGNITGISVVRLPEADESQRLHHSYIEPCSEELLIAGLRCCLQNLVDEAIYVRSVHRLSRAHVGRHRIHQAATNSVNISSNWVRRKIERRIIRRADIVCCTLEQVGSSYLRGISFDMLVLDDAQVASEIDCLISMTAKGLKQGTLLSDMRRDIRLANSTNSGLGENPKSESNMKSKTKLMPIKKSKSRQVSKQAKLVFDDGLEPGDLFERLVSKGMAPVALKKQYRMLKRLTDFPNRHFYLSRLETDNQTNEALELQLKSSAKEAFYWMPKKTHGTALFTTSAEPGSTSIIGITRKIVELLVSEENVCSSRLGIITNVINDELNFLNVKVGLIEDYFGQDHDYIILATFNSLKETKSATRMESNYLISDAALHIAVTRARLGLFIVTDPVKNQGEPLKIAQEGQRSPLCKSWLDLMDFYETSELIC